MLCPKWYTKSSFKGNCFTLGRMNYNGIGFNGFLPKQYSSFRNGETKRIFESRTNFLSHRGNFFQNRFFAVIIMKVPPMADSISEGTIQKWQKKTGDFVNADDLVCEIETDKVVVPIRAPEPGKIVEQFAKVGDTVLVNANLYKLDTDAVGSSASVEPPKPKDVQPPKPVVKAPSSPPPKTEKIETPKTETPKNITCKTNTSSYISWSKSKRRT